MGSGGLVEGEGMADIQPQTVEEHLKEILGKRIHCFPDGDVLAIDTPYILQDGHFLRAYLDTTVPAGFLLSDGGYIQRQLETFCRSTATLRARIADVQLIAKELSLEWDGEMYFTEPALASAMNRIAVLARAVDRSLSLPGGRPPRRKGDVRSRLREQLMNFGLTVTQRTRPEMPNGMRPVVVDQLVRRNGSQAAVEILTAKTEGGAVISVDRAIANFHVLDHYDYQGAMIAVYDRQSPTSSPRLLERFNAAKPEATIIVPDEQAAKAIQERLAG